MLRRRGVSASRVRALASSRSIGSAIEFGDEAIRVSLAEPAALRGVGLVLLCADAALSRSLAPVALEEGATVIDNSSAFRLDPDVPLVIPEVNGELIDHASRGPRLYANPNCCVAIMLMALEPLRRAFGVCSIHVSTYQAVSGAGQGGIDDLRAQLRAVVAGGSGTPTCFSEPCALNVFSHDSEVDAATGLNGEERKIIDETRKIWRDPTLGVTPTCVRVPVLRAHSQSIHVELAEAVTEGRVREVLGAAAGVVVVDDRQRNSFPTPLKATGRDEVFVGRLRPDPADPGSWDSRHRRWCLFVCGDQLRKGAAGNAIQIAERAGLFNAKGPG